MFVLVIYRRWRWYLTGRWPRIEVELLIVAVGTHRDDLPGRGWTLGSHGIYEIAAVRTELLVSGDGAATLIASLGDHIPPSAVLCHGYVRVGRQNV